jgi:hypothetical protein
MLLRGDREGFHGSEHPNKPYGIFEHVRSEILFKWYACPEAHGA